MITKPLLAALLEDVGGLPFPLLATPKLDGIRCVLKDGKAVSRKFIDIPNDHIRTFLEAALPPGMDGEIVCPGKTFTETQSLVMSKDGTPEFVFYIFDYVKDSLNKPYSDRCEDMRQWMRSAKSMVNLVVLFPVTITCPEELERYAAQCALDGYEGIMLRLPNGRYKCGRSTEKECILVKYKPMEDSEAIVVGFVEAMQNNNPKLKDNLGNTKRSSAKANKTPKDTLGTLLVRDVKSGVEFGLGTGWTAPEAKDIWYNQDKYIGKTLTYQYQKFGTKDKPRIPSFKGFRDERDISE